MQCIVYSSADGCIICQHSADDVSNIYRVRTGQGKLEKVREFEWSRKGQGKYFFGKVRENEKLVPPDVRFSG